MIGQDNNHLLLIEDEFRGVLDKCAIPNSTLSKVICKLWNNDRAGVADKKGVDECWGNFSILGGIPIEDAADFANAFSTTTTKGTYDRFLFGYDTVPVKYVPMNIKAHVFPGEMIVTIPAWVWQCKNEWIGTT